MTPEELSDGLIRSRNGGPRLSPHLAEKAVATLGDAYQVQRRVAQSVGPVGGFKTGRRPGEPQIMAPIFRRDIRKNPASFGYDDFNLIGIELEVGFIIDSPLPDPMSENFEAELRNCVSAVAALEIVDTRLTEIDSAPSLLRLADNQLNGALVAGIPCSDWDKIDLTSVNAKLVVGSAPILEGRVSVPGGDAFATLCGLVRIVGSHCGGLEPGHIVITGSLNGLPFIERGKSVVGWIEGLGEVKGVFGG